MKAIDTNEIINKYFNDPTRKIPQAHLNSVCMYHKKEETCRYICLTVSGFCCVKKTPMKNSLDQMVLEDKMSAKADNCEGLGD